MRIDLTAAQRRHLTALVADDGSLRPWMPYGPEKRTAEVLARDGLLYRAVGTVFELTPQGASVARALHVGGGRRKPWASFTREERFWNKVDRRSPSECWPWQGTRDYKGYGKFYANGKATLPVLAHRFSYELAKGPMPAALVTDHLCRNRACVNPAHLEAVTSRINTLRGDTIAAAHAAKTHCPQGHPYAGDNLKINSKGSRECRICARKTAREYARRKYAADRSAA